MGQYLPLVVLLLLAVVFGALSFVASRLLAHALRQAQADGLETTTLQASKLGAPVYERLGYRDFGAAQMWERRKD